MTTCRYCNFGLSPNEMHRGICRSCQPDNIQTKEDLIRTLSQDKRLPDAVKRSILDHSELVHQNECKICKGGLRPSQFQQQLCDDCEPIKISEAITVSEYAQGRKDKTNKIPLDLISPTALNELAKVLGFGADKYGKHNWRLGISWSDVYGAVLRHLTKWQDGQDLDDESGLPHLAHAMCGIMFLLEYASKEQYKKHDDRYAPKIP